MDSCLYQPWEGAWLKKFQQEIEELGQVSWIETKGTTDKRGKIGPDPFFSFFLGSKSNILRSRC